MYPAKPSEAAGASAPPSVPHGMYPAMPGGTDPAAAMPATGVPVGTSPGLGGVKASQWSSGLCDCFDDCGLCCVTYWCPCITFGRVAEIVDQGATSCGTSGALYTLLACFTGCQWVYSCTYRAKLRAQFGLPDAPCCDCCVHFCCAPCALCQEHRELKKRGYDPVKGWDFNAQRGAPMYAPAAHQGMGR